MRILITNDDGWTNGGVEILQEAIGDLGDVFIVLPESNQSAVSHAMTLISPLRIQEIDRRRYVVNGTPADCVRLGALEIMKGKVGLVISGINSGPNLGDDVSYSGTIAGAREGSIMGIPSFAISLVTDKGLHYSTAAYWARILAEKILNKGLPKRIFLSVNVPDLPSNRIKGTVIARQGVRIYDSKIFKKKDPKGIDYYWICGRSTSGIFEKGTDLLAIREGRVSITPLTLDSTSYESLKELKRWRL